MLCFKRTSLRRFTSTNRLLKRPREKTAAVTKQMPVKGTNYPTASFINTDIHPVNGTAYFLTTVFSGSKPPRPQ